MVAAETLQTLHRMHIQISDLQSRLDRGPRVIATSQAAVDNLHKAWDDAKDTLKRARMAADGKQLQLREREARVEELGNKLNGCSSNREYQTLKEQIAADKQANSCLEDEILESLEKMEELQADVGKHEEHLENAKRELDAVKSRVEEERGGLESELARVQSELAEVAATLPADLRQEYQRIANSRAEDALAPVEGEFCGGCNQKLTPQMLNELKLEQAVWCKSCGTLLYMQEES